MNTEHKKKTIDSGFLYVSTTIFISLLIGIMLEKIPYSREWCARTPEHKTKTDTIKQTVNPQQLLWNQGHNRSK